jgi:hypothetical protein
MEDLIANEGASSAHVRRSSNEQRKRVSRARRGGKGVIGMQTREGATEEEEGDFVSTSL